MGGARGESGAQDGWEAGNADCKEMLNGPIFHIPVGAVLEAFQRRKKNL